MARPLGYKAGLEWICRNDDIQWLFNDDPICVTACFLADMHGKDDETVRADLLKMAKRLGFREADCLR